MEGCEDMSTEEKARIKPALELAQGYLNAANAIDTRKELSSKDKLEALDVMEGSLKMMILLNIASSLEKIAASLEERVAQNREI
jgi:hypothetical protein